MIASILSLLVSFSPQAPPPVAPPAYVVSILNDREGDDVSLRFVLSGPPGSYSATREGNAILVRIAAEPLPGLSVPGARDPIRALVLDTDPGFTLRVTLGEDHTHEMVREMSSLRLILRKRVATGEQPAAAPSPISTPEPAAIPSPSPERSPNRAGDPAVADTADLYRRLFPSTIDPAAAAVGSTDMGDEGNWYSNSTLLGLQTQAWVSVSYVDGKTTQPATNEVTVDSYWLIQPNLGFGFSPDFGGGREGRWTANYSPRFRRGVDLELPQLTSHFFDFTIDQPLNSSSAVYGNYHFSTGVFETEEIDPGREYGIGLNRIGDTSLERFHRNSFGLGVRFDFLADTQLDVNANTSKVRYGDGATAAPVDGERAFFDYDTRTLNASLRRGLGESRSLRLLFGVHDTPTQPERKQVEGRGYSYGASVEGEIAALTTGRILFGYRTQKNPNAGPGGRDYQDITYAAQLVRTISDDTTVGLGADRNLYLSAYAENGFYVADAMRGDVSTKLPFDLSLRGSVGLQTSSYETSPQLIDASGTRALRKDKIQYWSVGLTRSLTRWAHLRVDYTADSRNSNLNEFDIDSRALTFQLSLGFFGKAGSPSPRSW